MSDATVALLLQQMDEDVVYVSLNRPTDVKARPPFVVLDPFDGEDSSELSVVAGELVQALVEQASESGWLAVGKAGQAKSARGHVPADFVGEVAAHGCLRTVIRNLDAPSHQATSYPEGTKVWAIEAETASDGTRAVVLDDGAAGRVPDNAIAWEAAEKRAAANATEGPWVPSAKDMLASAVGATRVKVMALGDFKAEQEVSNALSAAAACDACDACDACGACDAV